MSWTCTSDISGVASRPRASPGSSTPCAAPATFSGWTREAPVPPRPADSLVRGGAPGHPGRGQRAVLLGAPLEPAPAGGRVAGRRGADRPRDGRARRRRLRGRAGHSRAARTRLLGPVLSVPRPRGPLALPLGLVASRPPAPVAPGARQRGARPADRRDPGRFGERTAAGPDRARAAGRTVCRDHPGRGPARAH